jgi:hypothetical protein
MSARKIYQKPVLEYCGAVSERTLGGPSGEVLDQGNGSKIGFNNGNHYGENK